MNGCQDSIPYASCCNLKMSKSETFRERILQFGPPHQLLVHIILSVTYKKTFAALRLFWPPPSLSWSSLCFSREYPFSLKMVMGCLIIFLLLSTVLIKHPDLLVFSTKQWKQTMLGKSRQDKLILAVKWQLATCLRLCLLVFSTFSFY